MADWDSLNNLVNQNIDAFYGEPVRLLPYKPAGGGFSTPSPDGSRSERVTRAYVISKGTFMRGSGELARKRASADILMAIEEDRLATFRKGDRVILTKRSTSQMYELSYVEESTNGMPKVHLLRVNE
jgi:hypothetical protein